MATINKKIETAKSQIFRYLDLQLKIRHQSGVKEITSVRSKKFCMFEF